MADEALTPVAEESRTGRYERNRRVRRTRLLVGGGIGLVVLAVLALLAGRWYGSTLSAPPPYVVVVGESVLEDGTKTAGVVSVVERTENGFTITPVDAGKREAVPGTSFDRLSDALAMGGPALVARLVAEDLDGAEEPAWLLLEQQGWAGVVQAAGDATVSVEEPTTAFTGEKLYRFAPGEQTLSGDEVAALLLAAESFERSGATARTRLEIGGLLGEAVTVKPEAVYRALDDDLGEYSGSDKQLRAFLAP